MEQEFPAEARPDYYDPSLQPGSQHGVWKPTGIEARPDLGSPSPPQQHSRVSFAPVSPLSGTSAGTPSSVGPDVGSTDHQAQFRGYAPVISRDSFQQDSCPSTPPPANDSKKSGIAVQEYALGNPEDAADYGTPPPPGSRFFLLTQSGAWKLLSSGWLMYGMFCVGVAFVVGHHALYTYLDGKPADDQIRMMRFGNLLSYAAKASLLASVVFAYRQQIWVTITDNVLRLKTIDSLFSAVNEPVSLLNWEFIKKGRIAMCLAILAWLFPLTVILTPATLTVVPLIEVKEDQCYNVRTLNFEQERERNWRNTEKINGLRGVSLSLWNCTVQSSLGLDKVPFNETFFDYWTDSSLQLELITAQSALTRTVIPRDNAAIETCGGGWNCSYTVSFKAPGYKCSELAKGNTLDADALERQGVPFNASDLIPKGNYSYIARAEMGDYASEQIDAYVEGAPVMAPPYPKNLGAFRTEPVLWVGYSVVNGSDSPPEKRTDPRWNTAFEAAVFRCEHYLTDYTVEFNYTFSQQTIRVLESKYLHPIINTTFIPNKNATDGTKDNTTATPETSYVLPLDVENYRLTAAYHSIGKRLRSYLNGRLQYTPYAIVETQATKTSLIDIETFLPARDLMAEIQHLYENVTLSLLSNPQFFVVSWAADPTRRSGNSNATADPALAYPCVKTRVANTFAYNRAELWTAYAVAVGAACFAVVLGSAALRQNGFRVRDARVSSIVAATRALGSESLPWEAASEWGGVSAEILDMKLGYGAVAEPGPGPDGAPGAASGRVYYGLAPREALKRTGAGTFVQPGQPRNRKSALRFWARE